MIVRRAIFFFMLLWGCGGGTSPLAKSDGGGGTSMGGAGGAGGASATTSATSGTGGSGGIEEPAGPTKLTIVDGIVDADAIQICFSAAASAPIPTGIEGLAYAQSMVVVDPPAGAVEMFVIAGDLTATGASCPDLVAAPPPGVIVRSVGLFPEGVFTAERSIVLVANGCVGGAGHTHPDEALICGAGYDAATGNASVVAGFMSRIAQLDKVPLQFVQASLAMPTYELRVKSSDLAPAQLVVADWSAGAIAPFPPYMALSEQLLITPDEARVGVYAGPDNPIFEVAWATAFANSTVTSADVENGHGLVFVAVGPAPGVATGGWWNDPTYTVLLADP